MVRLTAAAPIAERSLIVGRGRKTAKSTERRDMSCLERSAFC